MHRHDHYYNSTAAALHIPINSPLCPSFFIVLRTFLLAPLVLRLIFHQTEIRQHKHMLLDAIFENISGNIYSNFIIKVQENHREP